MPYIVYKTTNLINNNWYIGVHKTPDNKKPLYIGSGDLISDAIKKYGRSNFIRETLFTFNTAAEAYTKEAELVTSDVVKDKQSYNARLGGEGGWENHININKVIVKDINGNRLKVDVNDSRYISGELVPWNKGYIQSDSHKLALSESLKGIPKARYICDKCGKSVAIQSKNRHDNGKKSCIPK